MSTTQDDIFDAARYSGWQTRNPDPDGVIFTRDDLWVTVMWTKVGTVKDAFAERKVPPAPGHRYGGWETVEDITGRDKATRIQSILWAAAKTPETP